MWGTSYPAVVNVQASSFELLVEINEDGTVYYAVLPDGAAAPSSEELRDGSIPGSLAEGSLSVSGSTEGQAVISGLVSGTSYDLYVVAEDAESSCTIQAAPEMVDVRRKLLNNANLFSSLSYAWCCIWALILTY